MKVYTLGNRGTVPRQVCDILGANTQHRQATVIVFARSKAQAFHLLGTRGMAPASIRDLRVAAGEHAQVLARVGLGDAPAVFALHNCGVGTVVRIDQGDGSATVVGELERAGDSPRAPMQFVPTPAGVAGSVFTEPMRLGAFIRMMEHRTGADVQRVSDACLEAAMGIAEDASRWDAAAGAILPEAIPALIAEAEAHLEQEELSADDLAAQCRANVDLVERLNSELAEARAQRQALARTAVERELVGRAADAFGVSAGRIYQLSDEFLVKQATRRRAKLGAGGGA